MDGSQKERERENLIKITGLWWRLWTEITIYFANVAFWFPASYEANFIFSIILRQLHGKWESLSFNQIMLLLASTRISWLNILPY